MAEPIVVSPGVRVPDEALSMRAVRSSGPGGQNVNKVSSKVELRVDLRLVQGLDEGARARLRHAAAGRLDADGLLLVTSQRTRDQRLNVADAREKVRELVAAALVRPRVRRKTRPGKGAVERRISDKRHRSRTKAGRRGED
ncbi:MAG: alternative ribosome rescue aminoacyl-tRNA hydrolase ArfB [Polyangiaceae bacterium]